EQRLHDAVPRGRPRPHGPHDRPPGPDPDRASGRVRPSAQGRHPRADRAAPRRPARPAGRPPQPNRTRPRGEV
ncbi:MAG: hypothetical protein AVDCRST_MAG49-4683, partial [uncultured Thermomicrobiales bacterium]